jgi:glycosyltransferase involved in cell wall biosynthesis
MKKINVMCPIGGTGYGITSLNIIKGLRNNGIDVSLFPIGTNFTVNSEQDKQIVHECIKNSSFFEYLAPTLKIWHQNELAIKPGKGRYATFPFFEIDKLSDIEKYNLNFSDIIFVASHWAKKVLINNSINRPIEVVPLAVDMEIFHDPIKIKVENPDYSFFHIGKWEKRKGQDFLIEAFSKAFSPNDNVSLSLLPHNPFLTEEETKQWINIVNMSPMKNKIKIYNRLNTQYDLANFIFYGDCGIFMSRAEGWNNEILECMAMNKPIITTNYSAHTEYCTDKNCFLVEIDELEPAIDNKWFNGSGNWAKLAEKQMDQTVEYMRYVYNNNIRTNNYGIETAKIYSWDNTAKIITTNLFDNRNKNASTRKKTKRR